MRHSRNQLVLIEDRVVWKAVQNANQMSKRNNDEKAQCAQIKIVHLDRETGLQISIALIIFLFALNLISCCICTHLLTLKQ